MTEIENRNIKKYFYILILNSIKILMGKIKAT